MVEPLKKQDIELGSFIWERIQLDKKFLGKENIKLHLKKYVEVSRVREQIQERIDDLKFRLSIKSTIEISVFLDEKIKEELEWLQNCFNVLLEESQSPERLQASVLEDRDKPLPNTKGDVTNGTAGVSDHKKPKAKGNIRFAGRKEVVK